MLAAEAVTALAALRPQHYHGLTIARLADELPDGAKPYKTRNGANHVNANRLAAHRPDPDTEKYGDGDPTQDEDDGE